MVVKESIWNSQISGHVLYLKDPATGTVYPLKGTDNGDGTYTLKVDTELTATIDPTGLATSAAQTTGNNSLANLYAILNPTTVPVSGTLDEADETTGAFTVVSPIVPVSIAVVSSSFVGSARIEYNDDTIASWKDSGETITGTCLLSIDPCVVGRQFRVYCTARTSGSLDVTIKQGTK